LFSDPLIFVRAVHFAATALACGTVAFLVLAAEPAARGDSGFDTLRRQLVVLVWIALAVAVLSGAAWLILLASDILGVSIADACLHGGAWPVVTDTRFGLVWAIRFVLALSLGLLMLWPAMRMLQLAAAAGVMILPALVGHAGATPGLTGDLHLASDMTHLLAAGVWLGSLPALALTLTQARNAKKKAMRDLAAVATRRFSLLGMTSVGALLLTGLINSWNLMGGPRDLLMTEYGRLVMLKIGLFAAMIAIAAANRFYLTPRLPESAASRALTRNSLAELGLGLCVQILVGILGTLSPSAHVHAPPPPIPPEAAFVHIHDARAMADVTIDPGHPGKADVTIRVMREDTTQFAVKDVTLVLDPPKAGAQSTERLAAEQSDGAWLVNDVDLPDAGIWTVKVTITTKGGARIVLDAPIVIER
jgi:putative copper resistance protein D